MLSGKLDVQRSLYNLHRRNLPLEKLHEKAKEYIEADPPLIDEASAFAMIRAIEAERGTLAVLNENAHPAEEGSPAVVDALPLTKLSSDEMRELLHKRETVNKVAGTWAYTKFMYSHFLDEHLQGHHKNVSTFEDPATSRKNESLWAFIPRSIIGGHLNTWKREVKRIKKEFGEDVALPIMLFNNKMVMYFLIHASICGSIFFFLGLSSLKYQFCYTCMGMFFLELINYIEHYGL